MFKKAADQEMALQANGDQPEVLQDDDLDAVAAGRDGTTTRGYFKAVTIGD
jgi:hypothetical protein